MKKRHATENFIYESTKPSDNFTYLIRSKHKLIILKKGNKTNYLLLKLSLILEKYFSKISKLSNGTGKGCDIITARAMAVS